MSMIGNYLRVTEQELAELRENPDTIYDVLSGEGDDRGRAGRHLDIDKSWHGIHFLLNGDPWGGEPPLNNAVLGGTPISDEDVGYGPARALDPEEVRAVSDALEKLPAARLLDRFDAGAMNRAEIYSQGWRDNAEDREYLSDFYAQLVRFFKQAAEAGDAMILYLN